MSDLAVVAVATIFMLVLVLTLALNRMSEERKSWQSERRSLVDRAISRHTGEILALDRQDVKTQNGETEVPRQRVQNYPEGL